MNYWLDLFTGTTWKEFLAAGSKVSGFRSPKRSVVDRIKPGDVLLCYLTGVMRWVGALEVVSRSKDQSAIWADADFPERLDVKPLVVLSPEHGVPMEDLVGKVDFYEDEAMRPGFKGFLRGSPNLFKRASDGELILSLLRAAEKAPVARPVDPRKLARKPIFTVHRQEGGKQIEAKVTVPEEPPEDETGDDPSVTPDESKKERTRHSEIQHALLLLGAEMGLDLWVARNDRSRTWQGTRLGDIPGVIDSLPAQFNEATNRTIELIDVLWLKGNSIVAAFEVECTTSVYSGILRMSDLLALQPNLDIRLFLVAPDERREKVAQEIRRPTFALREKPLPEICGFISFSKLTETVGGIRKLKLASSLQPSFLRDVAEYFGEVEEGE